MGNCCAPDNDANTNAVMIGMDDNRRQSTHSIKPQTPKVERPYTLKELALIIKV